MFVQLGPRLTLQLIKIEAGLCGGEVLYHSFGACVRHMLYIAVPMCSNIPCSTHCILKLDYLCVVSTKYMTVVHLLSILSVQKSRSAVRTLRREKDEKRELKAHRKREQEENVARKIADKAQHKERCLAGMSGQGDTAETNEEDDDKEWYRQEVGEEPDPGGWSLTSCVYIIDNLICLKCD